MIRPTGDGNARHGLALPLVIFALVLTGALVLAVILTGQLEVRAAGHVRRAHAARLAADGVWPGVLESADSLGVLGLASGDSLVLSPRRLPGRLTVEVVVRRLNPAVFLIESRAFESSDPVEALVQVVATVDSSLTPHALATLPAPYWSALPPFR